MRIRVKVKPGAKREAIRELDDGTLEVSLRARPERGQANQRLIQLLAKHYVVSKSRVRIVTGHSSRWKLVEIQ